MSAEGRPEAAGITAAGLRAESDTFVAQLQRLPEHENEKRAMARSE